MKVRAAQPIDSQILLEVGPLLREGANLDAAIDRMRALGLNKVESIKLLRDRMGFNLAEAKRIVHESAAWASQRNADDALHDQVIEAAGELRYDEERRAGSHRLHVSQ